MNNHEDYVTYDQAVKLKELGFDWECNHSYYGRRSKSLIGFCTYHDFNKNGGPNECSAPTLAQAQKWLREVKETEIIVNFVNVGIYDYIIYGKYVNINSETYFNFYEQALSTGINRAIELLKQQTNGNQD